MRIRRQLSLKITVTITPQLRGQPHISLVEFSLCLGIAALVTHRLIPVLSGNLQQHLPEYLGKIIPSSVCYSNHHGLILNTLSAWSIVFRLSHNSTQSNEWYGFEWITCFGPFRYHFRQYSASDITRCKFTLISWSLFFLRVYNISGGILYRLADAWYSLVVWYRFSESPEDWRLFMIGASLKYSSKRNVTGYTTDNNVSFNFYQHLSMTIST